MHTRTSAGKANKRQTLYPYLKHPNGPSMSHYRLSRRFWSVNASHHDRRLSRQRKGPSFFFVQSNGPHPSFCPDGEVIDFVLETVRVVLDTGPMISVLATFLIPDDQSQSILSRLEWQRCKKQVIQVLDGSHPLHCSKLNPSHFGRTARYGGRIEVNEQLVRSLHQATLSDPNVWFLVGLAITTILHQLAHYVRIRCQMPITPPMRHFSKFYSKDKDRRTGRITVHGESGYVLEAMVWGGVFTGLFEFQHDRDCGNYNSIGGAIFETSPSWSISEYLQNSGPALSRYVIDQDRLRCILTAMREGHQVQYPVFDPRVCSTLEQTPLRNYFRLQPQCSEQEEKLFKVPMYVASRGPTIRTDDSITC